MPRALPSLEPTRNKNPPFGASAALSRALGREEWENRRFQASNGELEESGIRLQLLSAWFAPLVTLTVNLGIAAVLWAADLHHSSH